MVSLIYGSKTRISTSSIDWSRRHFTYFWEPSNTHHPGDLDKKWG